MKTAESKRAVFGAVYDTSKAALRGALVEVVDRDLRTEELLGRTKTDSRGRWVVDYSEHQFRRAEKQSADIVVRVLDAKGAVLVTSAPAYNAPDELEVNLRLPRRSGAPEFDRYQATLAPLLEKLPVAELTAEDIEFLSHETGISPRRLGFLALSARWRKETKIDEAVFYGLLRRSLPSNLGRLLATSTDIKRDALRDAVDRNIIGDEVLGDLDKLLAFLEHLAAEAEVESSAVLRLAASANLSDEGREELVRFSLQNDALHGSAFWDALLDDGVLEADEVSALRFAEEVSSVTSANVATTRALQGLRLQGQWAGGADVARLRLDEWERVAKVASKEDPELGDVHVYARELQRKANSAFPGASLRFAALDGRVAVSDEAREYLEGAPEFDLLDTPISAIPRGAPARGELAKIRRLGRVTASATRPEVVGALIALNVGSAADIVRMGKESVVEGLANVADRDDAEAVYVGALETVATVEVRALEMRDYLGPDITPYIPNGWPAADAPDEPGDFPDWADLFGRRSACRCEHCRSILGPAAYFVDLMKLLDNTPLLGGGDALAALLERRPDLDYILLNCHNATTPMPYIDLVIERIEDAVLERRPSLAPPPASTEEAWQTFLAEFQTGRDAAALRAQPEHESRPDATEPHRLERWAAWELLDAAKTPWTLPFHPYRRKASLLAEHLGVAAGEVRALFGAPRDAVTRAELALESVWELVTTVEADPASIWGADYATLGAHGGVGSFLQRARLTMAELEALLATRHLDEAVRLERDPADPCDLSRARLMGLDSALDRIQRFLRLRHALELPIEALDELLANLGISDVSADALAAVAGARRLAHRLNTTAANVATLDASRLAALLRVSALEVDELVSLTGRAPFDAAGRPNARIDALEGLLDDLALIEEQGLTAAELRYLLASEDRAPAVFAPRPGELEAFGRAAHRALGTGAEPGVVLAEALAPLLSIPSAIAALLGNNVAHPSDPTLTLFEVLETLVAPTFEELLPAQRESADTAARLLQKIARLVSAARIDLDALAAWLEMPASSGFLDPRTLPAEVAAPAVSFDGWRMLARGVSKADTLHLIHAAHAVGATVESQLGHLAESTGANIADVLRPLHEAFGFTLADYQGPAAYQSFGLALGWLARFEVDPPVLVLISDPEAVPVHVCDALEAIAAARHSEERDWWEVLTPINDELREAKRDALVAYMTRADDVSVSDLYAGLLLDTEMSSCAATSRIKQANASIQLFIQRLRMNLEEARLRDDAAFESWDWMKYYRVWEANRKVFLFPENWIEPELRDDKSAFFRQLEDELLQDEPTEDVAEAALRHYIERLDAVARLDVRGIFQSEGHVHVIARTYAAPHTYYYRTRNLLTWVWGPWEPLDVGIRGDHVFPVEYEGRLFVIWGEAVREVVGDSELNSLQLKWVERLEQGWSEPRGAGGAVTRAEGQDWSQVDLRISAHEELVIEVYAPAPLDGEDRQPINWAITGVSLDPCTNQFRNVDAYTQASPLASIPPRMVTVGQGLEEAPGDEGALRALGTNPASSAFERSIDLEELKRDFPGLLIICGVLVAGAVELDRFEEARTAYEGGADSKLLMGRTPGRFRLLPEVQEREFRAEHAFALTIEDRVYFSRALGPSRDANYEGFFRSRLETFFHPHACAIVRASKRGAEAVMQRDFDGHGPDPSFDFLARYYPFAPMLPGPYPTLDLQFGLEEAYSVYNWEIFLHIPMLVATRLTGAGRYEEAQKWLHYVFDPTKATVSGGAADCWQFPPLRELARAVPETLDELLERIARGEEAGQIEILRKDPFNPHAIARLRRVAYMKDVVMAYLDNLIAWADSLFAADTIETLNEATQLYVLAAELLGEEDVTMSAVEAAALTWREVADAVDDPLSNLWLEIEAHLPESPGDSSDESPFPRWLPYFCVPRNDKLRGYRATIADRLFKVRHCQNIAGVERQLPLFEPPIDPALLVRARASGLDLGQLLGVVQAAPLSPYRFEALFRRAVEAAGEVRSFGAALLSSLEKKDNEALTLLRTRHEASMLDLARSAVESRIREAEEALASLRGSRASVAARLQFYEGRDTNAAEHAHVQQLQEAHYWDTVAEAHNIAASIAHAIPDVMVGPGGGVTFGGTHIGHALRAIGSSFAFVAGQYNLEANLSSIQGGRQHRQLDWGFQARQAETELESLDHQIEGALIRLEIARHELGVHDERVRQSRAIEDFLRRKFTGEDLYGWMSSRLAALHHQAYRLALDLARLAERAAQHELGDPELRVIGFDHFDSSRRGLLAGEQLGAELRRLESRYLSSNVRELDLTRHVSVAALAPRELLRLRETGSCSIEIPEVLFDIDYPGHMRRRIKSVSVTIPCVAGPYSTINATLRLTESRIRSPDGTLSPFTRHPGPDAIATSSGQNDAGLFELNFRDERYLPFEGAGAISRWELTISDLIHTFDHDSISDVILHLRYSARPGDVAHRDAPLEEQLETWLDDESGPQPMQRVLSLRREFSGELHRFLHPVGSNDHEVTVEVGLRHFAHFLRDRDLVLPVSTGSASTPVQARVYLQPTRRDDAEALDGVTLTLERGEHGIDATISSPPESLPFAEFTGFSGSATSAWTLRTAAGAGFDPSAVEDVLLELTFRAARR